MNSASSRLVNILILSDSHGKCINGTCSTNFHTVVKPVSGLKWKDHRDTKLCLYSMLLLPDVRSYLSEADAILLMVGTNSIRILPSWKAIEHVRETVLLIRETYPQFHETKHINIALTFTCLKTTKIFPNRYSLSSNIDEYNYQLKRLSLEMNFTILDFQINEYHLARDGMHLRWEYHHLIVNSISNHFNEFIPSSSSSSISSTAPGVTVSSSTSTSNEIEIQSQSNRRSRQSNNRRNQKRHEKLKEKREQHMIKRKVYSSWTLSDVKQYLRSFKINYGRILPIFNETLRIQFNNQQEHDDAESTLGNDTFDENRYREFIKNKKP